MWKTFATYFVQPSLSHWPDCNWCPGGKSHLAQTGDSSNDDSNDKHDASPDASFLSYSLDNPYQYFLRPVPQNTPDILVAISAQIPTPVALPSTVLSAPNGSLKTPSSGGSTTTVAPAQAAAKTTKSPCTPSPTRPMAPSASKFVGSTFPGCVLIESSLDSLPLCRS